MESGQTDPMRSQKDCITQAEHCEARAVLCIAGTQQGWLEMARQWRSLASDQNAQATTARLMNAARTS